MNKLFKIRHLIEALVLLLVFGLLAAESRASTLVVAEFNKNTAAYEVDVYRCAATWEQTKVTEVYFVPGYLDDTGYYTSMEITIHWNVCRGI